MSSNPDTGLSAEEIRFLRDVAGTMVPPSPALGMPGASDAAIVADIAGSCGRDLPLIRAALKEIVLQSSGDFARLDQDGREAVIEDYWAKGGAAAAALARAVLGAYYR